MSTAAPGSWDREELIRRLAVSGLRGRGGGWFPTARKWRAVLAEGGRPFVVANGAEGEPGSIKDRYLMMTQPADVLRGLAMAARALGSEEAVVYLKGSFARPAACLEAARAEAALDGLTVTVVRGEDGYIAGEETAVLESLEGKRPWPRPKPPLPSAEGYRGRPTLVQNVETLAMVPAAVADPAVFARAETTLVSLWGHVRRPGVYRVPLGTPLRELIDTHGEGAPDGVGMIFPAGPSGAPLRPEQQDTPLDPDALRAQGSALGTAAVLVVGRSSCPVAVAASLAGFFEKESCGQCPPCTLGTMNLARVLRGVESGHARARDLQYLEEAAGFMAGHGYCAHGRTAAASVTGLLARFPHEVRAHLDSHGCPAPGAKAFPFDLGSPERAGIEAVLEALP